MSRKRKDQIHQGSNSESESESETENETEKKMVFQTPKKKKTHYKTFQREREIQLRLEILLQDKKNLQDMRKELYKLQDKKEKLLKKKKEILSPIDENIPEQFSLYYNQLKEFIKNDQERFDKQVTDCLNNMKKIIGWQKTST
ncbi:hypothetical protein M0812_23762 [Anaeramoeba flamelloides]|uniref:Uncharacterized protein n=1 Tax=Anaeramoeba flamelloides TaxID=1746091 RepID=A0AAV7YLW2_9EUKA|nr:hypothetical protein M0812_23762 [Anaeramoeba flamelloides]